MKAVSIVQNMETGQLSVSYNVFWQDFSKSEARVGVTSDKFKCVVREVSDDILGVLQGSSWKEECIKLINIM